MADLFAKALLAAHKVTGDMRVGMNTDPILDYTESATTPRGSITDEPHNLWPYLCNHPLDGWFTYHLMLADHLALDPRPTLYVGAGSGRMSVWLGTRGVECWSVDIADEGVELMGRRGIECDQRGAADLGYKKNQFKRVVVHNDGLLDAVADPTAFITEAARVASDRVVVTGDQIGKRVASDRVVVTGDQIGKGLTSVPFTWWMEWQGQRDGGTYYAHPIALVERILVKLGMRLVLRRTWAEDDDPRGGGIYGIQYLIEARW